MCTKILALIVYSPYTIYVIKLCNVRSLDNFFHVNIKTTQESTRDAVIDEVNDVIIIDADQREEEEASEVDQQEARQEECEDNTDLDDMSEEAKEEVHDITVETNSDNIMVCKNQCCNSDRREPYQPTSTSILNATKRVQGEGRLWHGRVAQTYWFNLYPWLTLCETKNKLLCFYCFNAVQRKLLTFSKKAEATFSKTGFCNWKRALEKFAKHESSQAHSETFMKMTNKVSISTIMNPAYKEQQQRRQKSLLKQLSSLQYLLRQGLAIASGAMMTMRVICYSF